MRGKEVGVGGGGAGGGPLPLLIATRFKISPFENFIFFFSPPSLPPPPRLREGLLSK